MRRIYTKGGDKGKTSIFGGIRVDKDDVRVDANGELDELNSRIGLVRTILTLEANNSESESKLYIVWNEILKDIQAELMAIMSRVATISTRIGENKNKLNDNLTQRIEMFMDEMMLEMGENGHFILPGGTMLSSQLHLARTQTRKAERRLCTLNKQDKVEENILTFINRLSDLFFVMARYEVHKQKWNEEKWQEFRYKTKEKQSKE